MTDTEKSQPGEDDLAGTIFTSHTQRTWYRIGGAVVALTAPVFPVLVVCGDYNRATSAFLLFCGIAPFILMMDAVRRFRKQKTESETS